MDVSLFDFDLPEALIAQRAHGHISPWLLFVEAAPLAVGAGVLSHFLVERHFISRGSQLKQEGLVPDEPKPPAIASGAHVARGAGGGMDLNRDLKMDLSMDLTEGESHAISKV